MRHDVAMGAARARALLEQNTLVVGGTIVRLRDAGHEARAAKLHRQFEVGKQRNDQWTPIWVSLMVGAALAGFAGMACLVWARGGL